MKAMQEKKANFILFIVALIWGGGFIAGKMSLTAATPMAIIFYRYSIGAFMCAIAFRKRIAKASGSVIIKGIVIGLIQLAGQYVQLSGLRYTSSANQSFLCTAYVAFVPFISWVILRKRPALREFGAGFAALIGIGFICLKESLTIGPGDGLSVLFSLIFGIQIVLVGKLVKNDTDCMAMSFFQLLTVSVLSLTACTLSGQMALVPTWEGITGILYLGILNTFVAFVGQNYAQKYTRDTAASLIMSFESIFGFVFSVMYYGETVTCRFMLGGALCFAAVLINTMGKGKEK